MLKFDTLTTLSQATNVTSLVLGYFEDGDYKTENVTTFTGSVVQDGTIGDYVVIDFQIAAPTSDRTYESITIKSNDTPIAMSPKGLQLVQKANTILRCRLSAQFAGAGYCRFTNTHIDLPYATNTRTGVVRFYNENSDYSDESKAETVYSVKDIDTQLANISGKLSDDLVPWDKTAEGKSEKGKTTVQQLSIVNDYNTAKYTTTIKETGGQIEISSPITGDNAVSNAPVFGTTADATTITGSSKLVTETYVSSLYTDTVAENENRLVSSDGVYNYISALDLSNEYVTTDKTSQTIDGLKTFGAGLVVNNKITGGAVGTQPYYTYDTSTDPMTVVGISATGKVVSDNYISSLYSNTITEGDNSHFVTSGGVYNYISGLDLSNKYVTIDTEQTVTGKKTFDAGLVVNNKITGDAVYDTYSSDTLNDNTTDVITVGATSGYISAVKTEIEDKHTKDVSDLQSQIDGINAGQNLADIVGTYEALTELDVTHLMTGDKVQVLVDESEGKDSASTVYNLTKNEDGSHTWTYIGKYGSDSYTKTESDNKYIPKTSIDTEITADDTDSTVPSSKAVNTYVTNTINNLDLANKYVTVDTEQTVTGKKTFNNTDGLIVTTKITGEAVSSKPSVATTVDESTNITTTSVTGSEKLVNENYIAALYTDTVADGDSRLVTSGGVSTKLGEYVTLATEQTITGAKTFSTNDVTLDTVNLVANKTTTSTVDGVETNSVASFIKLDVNNSEVLCQSNSGTNNYISLSNSYTYTPSLYFASDNTAYTKSKSPKTSFLSLSQQLQPNGGGSHSTLYTTVYNKIGDLTDATPDSIYLYQGQGYHYYVYTQDECISFVDVATESQGICGAWYDFITSAAEQKGITYTDASGKTQTVNTGYSGATDQNTARIRLRQTKSAYDFTDFKYNGTHTFADIYADHIALLSGDVKFKYESDSTTHATDTILSITNTAVNSKNYTGGYILDDTDKPDTATNYYPFGTSTHFSINGSKSAFGDAAGLTKITSFDASDTYTPVIDDTTVATSKAVKDKLDSIIATSVTQASSITNNQPDVGFIGLFMYVGTDTPSMGASVNGNTLKSVGMTLPITGQIAYTASDSPALSGTWRLMNNAMKVNADDRCLVLAQKISNT